MVLYEYMRLSDPQQWNELCNNGQIITHFASIDCKYSLYGLHKFIVEVELCITTDKIIGKKPFVETHAMEKYLGNFNIN
ncbi:hypothetical protein DZC72_03380 [Maribacter algicola]|uniref:Uncharacterized protein n=1 Tax=Maribacter algicola TaxID=2498892 RepID=A0A426RKY3_9FLAO|nr:hypothetical protein DZC72_03380 [Maribacter algicola]